MLSLLKPGDWVTTAESVHMRLNDHCRLQSPFTCDLMTTTESVHMQIVRLGNQMVTPPFLQHFTKISVFFFLSLALSYIDIQKALVWFIKIMRLCHRAILAMGKSVDSGLAPYVCS